MTANMGSFSFNRPMSLKSLAKMSDISSKTQQHLSRTYGSLALCLSVSVLGVLAHINYRLLGENPQASFMPFLGMIGLMMWLAFDSDKTNYTKRLGILSAFGFLEGLSLGPLIEYSLHIDPAILVTALLGTITVFVCFSMTALTAKRRAYLYLGGTLSSAISFMLVMSFFNMFFRSSMVPLIHLYGGLFVFCGYVLYDTQLIVEKAESGDKDYVWHALELFIDFVAIFVRILIILMRNKDKKESRSSRR